MVSRGPLPSPPERIVSVRLSTQFSNSLIIQEESAKKINNVEDVWKSEEELHKLGHLAP